MTQKSTLISVIIPVFNEAHTIAILYEHLIGVFERIACTRYEIIFINDGSTDLSWSVLENLIASQAHIKALNFSRNFGHQAALDAGYHHAQGDCVISMDADLQDPPELIISMVDKWNKGAHIVYARRIQRNDGMLKRLLAWLYYVLLGYVAEINIPRNVGDFRLIDKSVLDVLNTCKEKSLYLRGIIAWTGFSYDFVDFKRPNRLYGRSGYSWYKMIKLGFDGITSFSMLPLRIAALCAVFVISSGLITLHYLIYKTIVYNAYYSVVTWCAICLYLLAGTHMVLLWILGEYIGRMYEQQKDRPRYIVQRSITHYIQG